MYTFVLLTEVAVEDQCVKEYKYLISILISYIQVIGDHIDW